MVLSTHCFFLGAENTSYGKTLEEVLLIFLMISIPVRVVVWGDAAGVVSEYTDEPSVVCGGELSVDCVTLGCLDPLLYKIRILKYIGS